MKTLRIFISSPGDVVEERAIAQRVIDRMRSEYAGRVVLEPVLWEHEPLVATANFQEQIIKPSETDIVIAILWSRLGTRLPKGFMRGRLPIYRAFQIHSWSVLKKPVFRPRMVRTVMVCT